MISLSAVESNTATAAVRLYWSLQDFKPVAKQLESAGLVSFQPHYLIWVCQFGAESEECKTQCIRNGAYCCPDPDDNIAEGYSGADVLLVSSTSLQIQQACPWMTACDGDCSCHGNRAQEPS
jgi:hypothetical protein